MSNIELMDVQGGHITVDHADVSAVYVTRMHRIPVTTVCTRSLGTMYVQESADKVRFLIEQEKNKIRSAPPTKSGAELIAEERLRQTLVKGYTPKHDDQHTEGQLLEAAYCYGDPLADIGIGTNAAPYNWPWDEESWKPSDDPVRNLTKAGALIAAEIDRLIRLGQ